MKKLIVIALIAMSIEAKEKKQIHNKLYSITRKPAIIHELKLLWYLNQLAASINNTHLTAQEKQEKELALEWLSRLNLEHLKKLLLLDDRRRISNH